jgi:hypothetical protein
MKNLTGDSRFSDRSFNLEPSEYEGVLDAQPRLMNCIVTLPQHVNIKADVLSKPFL